jgi:hypothetical protein
MTHTAFFGNTRIAAGNLAEIALAVRDWPGALVFEDATGRQIDLDTRGSEEEIRARHTVPARGPGRPKLGVTAREVTLLPRHWDWLGRQPGGASVALRKLVETASRDPRANRNDARDATYRLASALAGNAPGFEEAMRALYAGKRKRFRRQIESWPPDVRDHLEKMAAPAFGHDDED